MTGRPESPLAALNTEMRGWHTTHEGPTRPVVIVVGAPRSGTTLTYQLLASTGAYAYPTNFVARFFTSPALGHRIQTSVAPTLPTPDHTFTSNAGNTTGWWGAHEFSYFWRDQLRFGGDHTQLDPQPTLGPTLGAYEREAGLPLLMKSNLLCFAVPALAEALPTARFLHVRRSPVDTALSILRMRESVHGTVDAWWSIDTGPPTTSDPIHQVVEQVARCHAALDASDRVETVQYESLCADVHGTLDAWGPVDGLPDSFTPPRRDDPRRTAVEAAIATLDSSNPHPGAST